jgi:hypothetical protein
LTKIPDVSGKSRKSFDLIPYVQSINIYPENDNLLAVSSKSFSTGKVGCLLVVEKWGDEDSS